MKACGICAIWSSGDGDRIVLLMENFLEEVKLTLKVYMFIYFI